MIKSTFRFDRSGFEGSRFGHAFRAATEPRKPRHPLLRIAVGVVGVAVLGVLVFFSLFLGAAMLAVGLVYKLVTSRGKPVAKAAIVDAEYRVVPKPELSRSR